MPLRYITDTGTGNRTVNAGEKLGEAKQQAQNALTKGTGAGSGTQSRSVTNSAPAAAARQSSSPAAASLSPYSDITGAAGNDALYKVRSDSAQQTAFDRLRSGIRSAQNGSGETNRTTPSGVADRIRSGIRSMAEENRASGVSAMRERFEQSAAQAKQSYSQTIEGREAELNSRAESLTRESDSLREMQKTAYYQEKQLETLRAQIELDPQESYINEYMSVLALHDKIADDYNRRALLQQANIDDYNDQSRLLEQAKQERYYTEEYGQSLYDEYVAQQDEYLEWVDGIDPAEAESMRQAVETAKNAYEKWRSDMFTHAQSEALDALDENTLGYLNAIVDYNIETDSKRSSGLMMGGASGYVDYDSDVIAAKKQAVQALLDMGYTQEEIDSLAEYQQYRRNAEEMERMISNMEEYMGQSWGNAAVANIASIVLSPMQGLGMMEFLNRRVNKYAPLDVNSANFAAVNMVQAVRNKTSEDISASFNSRALGNTLSFLYQTGMSVADSGLLIAAVGPASVYLMGTSAAAAAAKDATERGASVGQAFVMALASGAAEVLTEKFSIENLLNNINSYGVARAMLRQAGVEASEEMTSEIANIISDAVIMGDRSNWHAKISEYMAAGMSEEDAKTQAFLDSLIEVGLAGLGGALSGGVMAGVGSGANNIRTAVSVNSQIGTLLNSGYQTGGQYAGTMENAARWNADGRLFSQESEQQAQRMLEQMRGLAEGTYAKYAAEGDIRPLRTFAQQQAAELADSINETLAPYGITVRADTSGTLEGTDCMIDLASGEVLIGPEVTDQDVFDFKIRHELGHAAARADASLVSETIELARTLGYDIDAIRQEKALSYFDGLEARGYSEAELTQLLTDEYLDEEIFGDLVWALDSDSTLIDNMAQRAPNLLTRILDCLRNLIARLTGRVPDTRLRNYQRIADNIRVTLGIEGDSAQGTEYDGTDSFTQRHSFAGRNANGANLETLRQAQEMKRQGAAAETIFSQTGWYTGADGMWRFEIDDSGMEFRKEGDARLMQEDGYRRLHELTNKWSESFDGGVALTEAETAEMESLQEEYSEQVWEEKYMLTDFVKHDELFKAYPRLRGVSLVFDELPNGTKGYFSKRSNTIVLSDQLFGKEADTLLHEIQHVIQKIEGFSKGSSPEYWNDRMEAGYSRKWNSGEEMTPSELYRNTAGEIEARDTASRRTLTAEERRSRMPDTGDENTVFVDADEDYAQYSIGETDDGRAVAIVDSNILSHIDTTDWDKTKKDQAKKAAKTALLAFKDGVQVNGITYKVNKVSRDEFTRSNDTERLYRKEPEIFVDKLRASANADDIITATTSWVNDGKLIHPRTDNFVDFAHGKVLIQAGVNQYEAETVVGITDVGEYVFYDVVDMVPTSFKVKEEPSTAAAGKNAESAIQESSSETSITENGMPVKEKFSATDSGPTDNPRSMGDDRWMYEDGVRLPTAEDTRPFGISDEDVGAEMDAMRRERDGIMLPRADGNTNSDGIMLPRADEGYYDSMLGEAENSPDWMGRRPENNRTNRTAPEETEAAFTADDIDEYEQYTREINRPVEPKAVYDADLETLPKKAQNYLERTERGMVNYLAELLGVPKSASREFLMPVAQKAAQEYINTGDISSATMQELFDEAYNRAVVIDNDYYEQYKEVRDRLRTTPVTISAADTADIADYDRWRRRQFNTLRIVNEGGTPVDTLYSELSNSYPELFPEYVTAPGDMLQRMSEVSRSIRKTETTLDSYYGEQAGDMRRELYNQFSQAMDKFSGEFNTVRRFYAEQEQKRLDAENFAARGNLSGDDVKTIKERWQDVKQLRREADKVNARNLLTDEDNRIVDMLLRGKMRLEDVPSDVNRRGITEVYHARQLYQAEMKEISDTNRAIKARYRADADRLLQDANSWKDKSWGLSYERETMERNVRDITGGSAAGEALIEHYFTPVHHNEAERTRVKNDYRDRVRALGLSRKTEKGNAMSESAAVQFYGEATDYIAQLEQKAGADASREGKNLEEWRAALRDFREQNPNLDMEKIQRSVEEFRKIYDELFEQMNDVRIRNGYEPVDYRKGYFPHFTAEKADGVLEKFGEMMGLKIRMDVSELPTSINGLTHTFRPGIRWFGSAQQRTGFATDYDALEGFDRYIEGVTDVIYHTDDIQRLRALSSQMRYRTTDAGLREQIDEIQAREDLSEYDKELRIKEVYEKGRYTLSKFVNAVEEYTNLLANKRAKGDRDVENALNRKFYNVVKTFSSRVAANMVAVNPGSWLTNFIPLVQGKTQLSTGELLRAMYDTVRAYRTDDGFVNSSDFLTNRRGSDVLVQSTSERISSALSSPMEYIDRFTADTLVRARYAQNLKSDMSHDEAISEADSWASEIMADRSKGSMPIVFEQKNPATKLFTQFQLEVNNQLSWMFKDLPKRSKERDKWAAYLAGMLIQYMLGAWVYNEFYEAIVGRRAALDPIDIANDFVGDLTGYQLPNTIDAVGDLFRGESIDFSTEKEGLAGAGAALGKNIAEELPFVGGLLGGGRLPISSALPDLGKMGTAAANLIQGENDTRYNLDQIADEAMKPVYYGALPFGGGQVKKVIQGIKSVLDGGVYSVNKNGEDILQYPVYNDSALDVIGNTAKGALFGPISTEGGQDWINSGFDSFSARETAVYQGLRELGVDGREAISLIEDISSAEDDGLKDQLRAGLGLGTFRTREEKQLQSLDDSALPEEARAIAYYGLIASGSEREKIDALAESGIDETTAVMAAYKLGGVTADFDDDGDEISGSKARNQFAALDGLETSDDVRLAVFYEMAAGDTMKGNIDALRESGLDDELIYSAVNAFAGCTGERDESGRLVSGSLKAEQSTALDGLDAYDSEKLELYYQLLASETELDNIDDLRESGLDSGTIYQGIRAVGSETRMDAKFRALRWLDISEDDAAAIYFTTFASDSHMEKFDELSQTVGLTEIEFYRYMDAVSTARYTGVNLIESLGLSEKKAAALYFKDVAGIAEQETANNLATGGIEPTEYYTYLRDTSGYEKTYDFDGDVISGSVTAQQLEYIAQMDDLDDTQKTFMWLNGAASATQRTMYEQNVVGARAVGIDIYTLACYITELFASTSEEYGSSRKEKVMAYIDSLYLNSEQKDYLYTMEYAASGLKNTPWHTGVDFSQYLVGDYDYGR